jgi:hypothetical protein
LAAKHLAGLSTGDRALIALALDACDHRESSGGEAQDDYAVPAPSAPRLAAQQFTAAGELLTVAICVVGVVTVAT